MKRYSLGKRPLSRDKAAMHSLPVFLRLRDMPVILLGQGEAADAKRRLLDRAGARVVGEAAEARLAIVAIEEEGEAQAAVARLKARGILVNATDRPPLCDFTLPAIIDRDPLIVAIGTGGASAGLAKAARIALEAILPAKLGALASALGEARAKIRRRWPDTNDRRRALDAALSPGGALDPLTADPDAIDRWLGNADTAPARFVTIAIRSNDPDDLTLREARLLGSADRIFHTPDIPASILDRTRADAARVRCDTTPTDAGDGLSLWLQWSD